MNREYSSPLSPWYREVLPNGLTLVVKEVHSAPIVAVDIWVRVGSGDESRRLNGISHFYEHMFFKGTPDNPVGVMDRDIKGLGGYDNAATSLDFTHYYIVVPSPHYVRGMGLLVDAFLNCDFPEEEIERERMVVLEEISRKEDSPTDKLFTDFIIQTFAGTPYEMEVLGTPESLANIDQEEFSRFKRERYVPANSTLVVAGNVEVERVREEVLGMFDGFRSDVERSGDEFSVAPITEPRTFVLRKDIRQAYLAFGYVCPPVNGTWEEYALEVAMTALGEGRSSRLNRVLLEEKALVSEIQAMTDFYRRGGFLAIYSSFDQKHLDEVQSEVDIQIRNMLDEGISDDELRKAQTMICTDFAFSNERISSIANTLGDFETNYSIEDASEYVHNIQSVTREQVLEAIRRYCRPNNSITGILLPSGKKKRAG